ncbi:PREDICTED: uncharacterized protein LOC106818768 [Priapulus caudatus]|uniref:Uncharacterized protein LOC106818768 n=1 Tax=Priapulus caudatus TaxID=37621 RepID=A0ABM1F3A8_PRICU|nr:PREDICTED: uncharacterized protein LOC106818768 [Priapulus caudatus]
MLLYGRNILTRLDVSKPNLAQTVQRKQINMNTRYSGVRRLEVGQTVITRDYRISRNKWVHGQIYSQTGPLSYKVDVDGTLWRRHLDQLILADISSAAPQNSTIPEMSSPAFISGGSRNAGIGESESSNRKATPAVSSPEKTPAVSSLEKTLTSHRTPPVTAVQRSPVAAVRQNPARIRKAPDRLNL